MISLIVVALVGIGFTRLTMLALELRDNFDEQYGGEQEVNESSRGFFSSIALSASSRPPRARALRRRAVDGAAGARSKSTLGDDASTRMIGCGGSRSRCV